VLGQPLLLRFLLLDHWHPEAMEKYVEIAMEKSQLTTVV
jgi:hypothetical protein